MDIIYKDIVPTGLEDDMTLNESQFIAFAQNLGFSGVEFRPLGSSLGSFSATIEERQGHFFLKFMDGGVKFLYPVDCYIKGKTAGSGSYTVTLPNRFVFFGRSYLSHSALGDEQRVEDDFQASGLPLTEISIGVRTSQSYLIGGEETLALSAIVRDTQDLDTARTTRDGPRAPYSSFDLSNTANRGLLPNYAITNKGIIGTSGKNQRAYDALGYHTSEPDNATGTKKKYNGNFTSFGVPVYGHFTYGKNLILDNDGDDNNEKRYLVFHDHIRDDSYDYLGYKHKLQGNFDEISNVVLLVNTYPTQANYLTLDGYTILSTQSFSSATARLDFGGSGRGTVKYYTLNLVALNNFYAGNVRRRLNLIEDGVVNTDYLTELTSGPLYDGVVSKTKNNTKRLQKTISLTLSNPAPFSNAKIDNSVGITTSNYFSYNCFDIGDYTSTSLPEGALPDNENIFGQGPSFFFARQNTHSQTVFRDLIFNQNATNFYIGAGLADADYMIAYASGVGCCNLPNTIDYINYGFNNTGSIQAYIPFDLGGRRLNKTNGNTNFEPYSAAGTILKNNYSFDSRPQGSKQNFVDKDPSAIVAAIQSYFSGDYTHEKAFLMPVFYVNYDSFMYYPEDYSYYGSSYVNMLYSGAGYINGIGRNFGSYIYLTYPVSGGTHVDISEGGQLNTSSSEPHIEIPTAYDILIFSKESPSIIPPIGNIQLVPDIITSDYGLINLYNYNPFAVNVTVLDSTNTIIYSSSINGKSSISLKDSTYNLRENEYYTVYFEYNNIISNQIKIYFEH